MNLCKSEENLILGFNFNLDINVELKADGLERRGVNVALGAPPVPELLPLSFLVKDRAAAKAQVQPKARKAKLNRTEGVFWISSGKRMHAAAKLLKLE